MARISYDQPTAAAYKAVREIPREGLADWRDAISPYLEPAAGKTIVDLGAGTGQFASAFADWFGIAVVAVEPSADMRAQIPRTSSIQVRAGDAAEIPLPDGSADAVWLSLVLHHIADLPAAAREIRRVLTPGAPVLIRQGFPGRLDGVELFRWFPETGRVVDTYPTVEETVDAFATAGFRRRALQPVRETYSAGLREFLAQVDTFRAADTTMRTLTDEEFLRGKERIRRALDENEAAGRRDTRSNWLDLLVLG